MKIDQTGGSESSLGAHIILLVLSYPELNNLQACDSEITEHK